jgi:CRISPR/Cas system Type II protein with McrA/HNH and RuvC-like nuclease domain
MSEETKNTSVKEEPVSKKTAPISIASGESGFIVVEFTEEHGTKKVGDKETYHHSTAAVLVNKAKVAKIVEKLKIYVPKKEVKS